MIKASDFIIKTQGIKAKAGYIVKDSQSSSVLYFFNLSDSSVIPLSDVYIPDTQVAEPQYPGSSGGSYTGMDFYKCAAVYSDSTWSGYKLLQNTDNGYSLEETISFVGQYYRRPNINTIYDATGKLKLGDYYEGDSYDPYGSGLLYSIFKSGGGAWCVPSQGIITTDAYASNIETIDGITARKFSGAEKVTTSAGTNRSVWSYSVWIRRTTQGHAVGSGSAGILGLQTSNNAKIFITKNKSMVNNFNIDTRWYHYVITYDNGSINVYMDKELRWTASYNMSLFPDTSSGFVFGQASIDGTYTSDYLTGHIANFRFYDHVLTSAEITALYNELTPTSN